MTTTWLTHDEYGRRSPYPDTIKRAGVIAETVPRRAGASVALASGTLALFTIEIPHRAGLKNGDPFVGTGQAIDQSDAGGEAHRTVVTSITFASGTTALSGGTHLWFALYDDKLNLLAQTADDTAPTWAANAEKNMELTEPYKLPAFPSPNNVNDEPPAFYYVGICVAATTPPTLRATGADGTVGARAPALFGRSSTGLTTTPPNPAAAITANDGWAWAAVGRTNLCTNPEAETDTTGWTNGGLVTFERVTSLTGNAAEHGLTTGFHCVGNESGDNARDTIGVTNGRTYRYSAKVYLDSNTAGGIKLQVRNSAGTIKVTSAFFTTLDGWADLAVEVTADESADWTFRIAQEGIGATDFYFSRVLVYEEPA